MSLIACKHPLVAAVCAVAIPVALPRRSDALATCAPELVLAARTRAADEHCQGATSPQEEALAQTFRSHLEIVRIVRIVKTS